MIRHHEPNAWITAVVGSVFMIGYLAPPTVAIETAIQADFAEHYREHDGPLLLMIHNVNLPLPLPPVEVRAMWRDMPNVFPRIRAVAVISPGLAGMAGMAISGMLAHFAGSFVHTTVRPFTTATLAVRWLIREHDCEIDEDTLVDQFAEICAA